MNLKEQIEELNKKGYKVEIEHRRFNNPRYIFIKKALQFPNTEYREIVKLDLAQPQKLPKDEIPVPKGGLTIARIIDGENLLVEGQALCHINDNFCRKIGANIALGRANKELQNGRA